jgi:hypothetical protein
MIVNVHVAQMQDGQPKYLKVYTYDELVAEEHTRQAIQAVALGLSAAGNSMSAAAAGHYNATATVSGPNGFSTVNVHGYDPSAAAIAQNRAAAQNEAMIGSAVEAGQRNLVNLNEPSLKMTRFCPASGMAERSNSMPPVAARRRITTSLFRLVTTRTK